MFSFGSNELLIIIFVAVLVIAPNDMPRVLKSVGKFLARARVFTRDFNSRVNEFIDNALIEKDVEDEEENK